MKKKKFLKFSRKERKYVLPCFFAGVQEGKHEVILNWVEKQNVQNRMGARSLWIVPEQIKTAEGRVWKRTFILHLIH